MGKLRDAASYVLGVPPLEGEDRQKAIDAPGPSWKEWALGSWMKGWVGLGLLVLDAFVLVPIEEASASWVKWSAIGAIPLLIYVDAMAYGYLWAPPRELRRGQLEKRTWLHPWFVGRWHPDRKRILEELRHPSPTGEVPPEEFL